MNEPQRTQRTQREESLREFLVLLRLFFQNWDAPQAKAILEFWLLGTGD